jgi:hypothetical protein
MMSLFRTMKMNSQGKSRKRGKSGKDLSMRAQMKENWLVNMEVLLSLQE